MFSGFMKFLKSLRNATADTSIASTNNNDEDEVDREIHKRPKMIKNGYIPTIQQDSSESS